MSHPTTDREETGPRHIDLWPGPVPGDEGIDGSEYVREHSSPIVGTTRLITNVTRPQIAVYLPEPARNTQTAVIVCPGGGYHDLFWELEGEEVAAWLTSEGMAAIILKYRCPRRPGDTPGVPPLGPRLDAQRAVAVVRRRSGELGIHPDRIGIMGFSAGGHLALATAAGFAERLYDPLDESDTASCRPDFAVPCYSGYLEADDESRFAGELANGMSFPPDTPPVFLAHAGDDSVSSPAHSVVAYLALLRAGVSAELHVFATGEHDFGVRRNEKLPSSWTDLLLKWLTSLGLLTEAVR